MYFKAREQKKTYQGLKTEVVSSQKSLYYSQQGFVRPRPLTAPNLSKYKPMDADEKRRMSLAVQNALQNKYQKLLRKAYRSKGGYNSLFSDEFSHTDMDESFSGFFLNSGF